jgi:glyoxylase-like metal-dependent hydrolase (beta-lactamase superfamily II)
MSPNDRPSGGQYIRPIEPAPGHPEIVRIVAANPGPMTLEGTNTYLVDANGGAWVIDPGPDDTAHVEAVRAAAEARGGIAGVVLTHSHADHSAGVDALGAPLLWGAVSEGDESGQFAGAAQPADPPPEAIGPFRVISTPGHAPDHVCFVLGRVCFCGDLILGHGSSIVPPAAYGGSLSEYMESLSELRALDSELLCPGHGPWITDPAAKVDEYVEHRRMRERRLLAALERGERARAALLAEVWDDVPEVLGPAAAAAMEAHLEKLDAEGRLPANLRD